LHKINVFGKNNKPIQALPVQNKPEQKQINHPSINIEKGPLKDKAPSKEIQKMKPPTPKFKEIAKDEIFRKSKEHKEIKQNKQQKENKGQKEVKDQKCHPKENKESKNKSKKQLPLVKHPSEPAVSRQNLSHPNIKKEMNKECIAKNQNINQKPKEEEKKLIQYYEKINKEEKKNCKAIAKNVAKEQKHIQNRKRVYSENRNISQSKELDLKNKNQKFPEIKREEISIAKKESKKEIKVQKEIKQEAKKIQKEIKKEIKKQVSKNAMKEMKDQRKSKYNVI